MVSIRAPRAGSDAVLRGVDRDVDSFNPRSPRGERHDARGRRQGLRQVSIRAPRAGSDAGPGVGLLGEGEFQSALPARGATSGRLPASGRAVVSIRAPRAGSDLAWRRNRRRGARFNPRSPRGERLALQGHRRGNLLFQSALPARGATLGEESYSGTDAVSIRAPRAGSDAILRERCSRTGGFNPRSPRGERRGYELKAAGYASFNPRSPRGERRGALERELDLMYVSIRAPRAGSDLLREFWNAGGSRVSIRAPRAGSDKIPQLQPR